MDLEPAPVFELAECFLNPGPTQAGFNCQDRHPDPGQAAYFTGMIGESEQDELGGSGELERANRVAVGVRHERAWGSKRNARAPLWCRDISGAFRDGPANDTDKGTLRLLEAVPSRAR